MSLVAILLSLAVLILLILFLPIPGAGSYTVEPPASRIHEADAVLSRRLLKPGTHSYNSYYAENPQFREADDRSRNAPGLLSREAQYYHPGTFAAAKANFEIIEHLAPLIHGKASSQILSGTDPKKNTQFISTWLRNTGAHRVGVTQLHDYHLYSHKGRGPRSGEPISLTHPHAIAITVEMDHRMMESAPGGSTVMESSEQYLNSGVLALKTAAFIRELGYEATAHIDGNYEVICPLVAMDAGLGVIGRMGLLMTPDLGPRVRISVVTTNLPLTHTPKQPSPTTLHFCTLCKKCAHVCPAAAIPDGPRAMHNGTLRWQINSERCYHYWTVSGTDCGRCMSSCPYSHPDNLFHRFIRWGVKNNLVFRHLAIKLDDVFYGRKPPVRPLPHWADILEKQ